MEFKGMLPITLESRKNKNKKRRRDLERLVLMEDDKRSRRVDFDTLIRVGSWKKVENKIEKRTEIERRV
jgi:hypothetical protein